MGMPKIRPPQN